MTKNNFLDELPSKKYKNELENGIHYQEAEKNMEHDRLTINVVFWQTMLPGYLFKYINDHMNKWSENIKKKRCRDLNHILDLILKKIKKKLTDYPDSYDLIKGYINNAANLYLEPWSDECQRNSKLDTHYDDIENLMKIDDLCEDIVDIKNRFSEINSDNCNEINNYIEQQISELGEIYKSTDSRYSDLLGNYSFKSFAEINNIVENLMHNCQEGTAGAPLVGLQGETSQYSGRSTSIIAVTSLSGILSSFILLYKTTSFGSILNNLVGKKIKFGNNLSDEAYHETLEDISEPSHDGGYNILYNSIGDT
ncbi:hypothetical protein, conserved [Plasmodium ovale]|uniref:PIR protein n=1 Tax=Plasmodium ovale TaxID=36330 RepID=A0A1C3KJ64_PLAOA|nr:hypothetical protein, conserved [Plasmodium ovale]